MICLSFGCLLHLYPPLRLKKIVSACSHHLLEGIKAKVHSCATESLRDLEECLQNMNKKLEGELQQCYVCEFVSILSDR